MKNWIQKQNWKQILLLLLCLLIMIIILRLLGLNPFLWTIIHTLSPLLFSCLIVFLFEPFVEKLPFNRGFSCTLVYFGFLALLALAVLMMVPVIMDQGTQLVVEASALAREIVDSEAAVWVSHLDLDLRSLFSSGTAAALSVTRSLVDRISFFGVSFIGAYFIALDLNFFSRFLKRHLPRYEHWLLFYKTSSRVVYHYLRGISLDLGFLFVSVALLLSVFQVRNALFYAFMLAVLNLIPYIGATIGQIIILFAHGLATGQIPWTLGILLWLIQQAEANWVQPMIFKKVMNLRPIFTFVALLAGGCFFGMVGIILAPILAAVVQLAYRSYLFAKCTETVGTWESVWYNFDSFENDDEEE